MLLEFKRKCRFANGLEWTYLTEKPYCRIEGTEGWGQAEPKSIHAPRQSS